MGLPRPSICGTSSAPTPLGAGVDHPWRSTTHPGVFVGLHAGLLLAPLSVSSAWMVKEWVPI